MIELHKRLIAFHGSVKTIKPTGFNPHFKSTYATLDDILTAVIPALISNGLYLSHVTEANEHGSRLVTRVTDEDGESLFTSISIPEFRDPQQLISYLTYTKRANISALLSLGGDLDDDGNMASASIAQKEVVSAPELATDVQWAILADYRESGNVSANLQAWIDDRADTLTEAKAKQVIAKIKAAAKKEKTDG